MNNGVTGKQKRDFRLMTSWFMTYGVTCRVVIESCQTG